MALSLCLTGLSLRGGPGRTTAGSVVDPDDSGALPATFFGLHIHRPVAGPWLPVPFAWPDIGIGAWRLWDTGVGWQDLEPRPGVWRFARLDSCVALAERHHVEVLLPLGSSPTWASARPSEPSAYAPGNAAEPRDSTLWINYVRTVATRYKDKIRAYEIWNEPNLKRFFSGDTRTLLLLARQAYRTLKLVDSACQIVTPPATGQDGLAWLNRYLADGGGDAADVIGFHDYVGQGHGPEDMAALLREVRGVAAAHGLGTLPLWDTETGWAIRNARPLPAALRAATPPNRGALPDSVAAQYVARCYLLAWAAGIARLYWYAWDNYSMGLLEPQGDAVKLAGRAYRTVVDWILGARPLTSERTPGGSFVIHFINRDGSRCLIAWNPAGRGTLSLPASDIQWRQHDLWGVVRRLRGGSPEGMPVGETPIPLKAPR